MSTFILYSYRIVVATLVLLACAYFYSMLHSFQQNSHLPQLPRSFLLGHLALFHSYTKQGNTDRHPDQIFGEMHETLAKPLLMLIDNWPIVPPMVVVASGEVAEQISRVSSRFPYSVPKSPSAERILDLVGHNSILLAQGEKWKAVRKLFNTGFASQHLITLCPVIVDKAKTYLEILDRFSESGEVFSLDQHTVNLTFDIIGAVVINADMNAQQLDSNSQGSITIIFRRLIKKKLKILICQNFYDGQNRKQPDKTARSRSILALSLQNIRDLTPEVLDEAVDQVKTLLFAGHDTTSTLIEWTIHELSRSPHALQAVRDEIDTIFGPEVSHDQDALCHKLATSQAEKLINKMTYISAVLKEVLRLYPPVGTIRMAKPGMGLVVSTSWGDFNLDGNWIYLNHYMIHRDRAVYGDTANDFVPERWLEGQGPGVTLNPGVWRPFERGRRSGIGQELANIEARVVIALIAHRYSFQKVGLGELALDECGQPTENATRQFNTKSKLYMTIQIAGKPVDGMMMKVHRVS